MIENYVSYAVSSLYIVGGISLVISVLAYVYLPQALSMIFEEESDSDNPTHD